MSDTPFPLAVSPLAASPSAGAHQPLSRRSILQWTATGTAALLLPGREPARADDAPQSRQPLNRFPRAVHEFLIKQVRRAARVSASRREKLDGRGAAAAYVTQLRQTISECFGPLPERTPLNPQVTGTLQREGYRVEKVIYESRPQFLVTANLYIPAGEGPFPAVLGVCGHSAEAKAFEPYQSFAQGLARLGFVCLIIDPIGQGERLQFPTPADAQTSQYGNGVAEHLHGGNQQYLVGDFFGTWRAWDGIRGIDYLLSRPEVDGTHIGVTGNSGGGTMTTWLTGLDNRITMSAPSCFVTTFLQNLENELPADTEQCPPDVIAAGLDHGDFYAASAPHPVTLLAERFDFFDIRGTRQAFTQLQQVYKHFDAAEAVRLHVGDSGHGIPAPARLAMYQTFCEAAGLPIPEAEPKLTLEKASDLWATPAGQVAPLGSKSIATFTAEKAESLASRLSEPLRGEELRTAIWEVLRVGIDRHDPAAHGRRDGGTIGLDPKLQHPPHARILRPLNGRGYPSRYATAYALETEPGLFAVTTRLNDEPLYALPARQNNPAIVYVAHRSADAELRGEPLLRQLIDQTPQTTVYACDVRGIGETQPDIAGQDTFLSPYGSDYLHAAYALMLGQPVLGGRTHDLLRVIDWVRSLGHPSVQLVGMGWGAIPVTFAAVLHDGVNQVTLKHALESYQSVAQTADYAWPLSMLVPGILGHFDLPDCYAELAAKDLRQIEPWGPRDGMNS